MRRKRMLWQLFPSVAALLLLAVAATYVYTSYAFRGFQTEQTVRTLEARARIVAPLLDPYLTPPDVAVIDSIAVSLGRATGTRITIVLPNGRVLGDTEGNPGVMERHDLRPEMTEAFAGRVGSAIRYSSTVHQNLLYTAVPIERNGEIAVVIRTAIPATELRGVNGPLTGNLTADILIILALVLVVAAAASLGISKTISRPIEDLRRGAERFAQGELSYTVAVDDYEEIAGLGEAMNRMAAELHDRIYTVMRQRNEQEAILAAMVEGVVAVDTAERILNMNAAASKLFAVRTEAAIGRSVPEVVRNSELHRLVSDTLRSARPVEGTIELTGDAGRVLQVHGSTLRDDRGRAMGAVIVLNDITRLRRLENVRREFVANVSHELRTPVTSIKGFLETLLDGAVDSPDDARRFLGIVMRQANQLNNIIEDLLALSRIEQGRDEEGIELSRQQVGRVVRSAMQSCEALAAQKKIKLLYEGNGDLTAPVNASLLEQAVVNLLNNAITYSPDESTVRLGVQPGENGVDISVADNGPGIEAQHLDRIFERFYRIDKARSRAQGGTGLGLAIVKHIALAHKGRVTVRSCVGQGSTFTIHLPAPPTA